MPSPVSIGDVFLMANLALKIGRAFTKGRKSAPAEFREVESQLYSLSAALSALKAARESENSAAVIFNPLDLPRESRTPHHNHQDVIIGMLSSCKETLDHLNSIVDQYSIVGTSTDPQQPRLKRWSQNIKANWKKIAWTTEGGDLALLRNNLVIHTNSLNLILGVVINTQTDRLKNDVDRISMMLTEIHQWFVSNLKNTAAISVSAAVATPNEGESPPYCYELHEYTGQGSKLICPLSSLGLKLAGGSTGTSSRGSRLFHCNCSFPNGDIDNHRREVDVYGLSPLSFVVRVAGNQRSWLLYKVTNRVTSQLTTLLVKGIPPDVMYEFEECVMHKLNVIQARGMILRNMNTTLVNISHTETQSPRLNLLETISDPLRIGRSVAAIKFVSRSSHYVRDSIDFVQVLHYKHIDLDRIWDDPRPIPSMFKRCKTAEILVAYRNDAESTQENDMVRTNICLRFNSQIQLAAAHEVVEVEESDCTSFDETNKSYPATSVAVSFQFATQEAASEFYKGIEATRMELFIVHLQFPRDDEKVVLRVQAQHVHTQRMHISDAEICILQNTSTQLFRLVVQSRRGYSVLSQELREDFFQRLSAQGRPDYGSMTYEVYLDNTGRRRIRQDPNGFTHLGFSDVNIDQLFAIGLSTLSGASTDEPPAPCIPRVLTPPS